MRFGIYLIGMHTGASRKCAPIASPDFLGPFARSVEELGFDSLFLVDHIVFPEEVETPYPYVSDGRYPWHNEEMQLPEPLSVLAFVAAVTRRIRLGTGVLVLPQRNPLLLAKQLATLDNLSRGRVELGIGMGWLREEFEALGAEFSGRGRRGDEYVAAMRALWREPVASFRGDSVAFERVRLTPRPVQPGGIPILVGGHSAAAARRAGRLGDGYIPAGASGTADRSPMDWVRWLPLLRQEAERAGRDPDRIEISAFGQSLEEAEQLAEHGVARMICSVAEPDLPSACRRLEQLAEQVLAKLG